ncbi:unnamed protein product [Rhizophagus irregularis]|nr:unnamed protein product [Rhizophagus irregularis]
MLKTLANWLNIEKNVSQNTLPTIKKALGDRFQYTNIELKKVLQNLHQHQKDAYTVSLDPLKSKANKQRTGINSRRKDVMSELDEEKVQEEKDNKIYPSRKESSNHVLYVYDKQWRSQTAQLLLRHADKVGETIQNIKVMRKRWYNDQTYVDNNSKPPLDAPKWTISTSYHPE